MRDALDAPAAPTAPAAAPPREHPLHVVLPYDMHAPAERATHDAQLQEFVNRATLSKDTLRIASFRETFGDDYDAIRRHAGAIKQHTLDHLDRYIEQFVERARAAGVQFHFAKDGRQANEIAVEIARERGCKLCVKSKSMVTEETGLVPRLEAVGVETIETDLGEFILQLDHDAPSHIVTPMIHKDRVATAKAFVREIGAEYTEDPRELTMIARRYLREKYRRADLGISGGNFLIAETGSLVICTNEGNGGLCTSGPPVHVAFVGIEKLIPRMEHLGVFLKLLARSSTAQPLTCYTHIVTGPRREHEHDGPREVHIVLVDNGRTELLRPETREMLRCIRCGACLNTCPVYRKVGGHAYGAVYSGPIGAILTPMLKGLANYKDLPQASSLCGACRAACPVNIDIPKYLIQHRRESVDRKIEGYWSRLAFRTWTWWLSCHRRYWFMNLCQREFLRLQADPLASLRRARTRVSLDDPLEERIGGRYDDRQWVRSAPPPIRAWTNERDMPSPTSASFRHWWRTREASARDESTE